MEKLLYFFARRPILSKLLLTIFVALPYCLLLLYSEWSKATIFILAFVLEFALLSIVNTAPGRLMDRAVRTLQHQCDPYPLLDVTGRLLPLPMTPGMKVLARLNHSAALLETGKYAEALAELEQTDPATARGMNPVTRYFYANNRSSALDVLKRPEEAEEWFRTSAELYDALPPRLKERTRKVLCFSQAESHLRRGEYEKALELAKSIRCMNRQELLSQGTVYVKCALGMDQPEIAKQWLRYIIANGNRLHAVAEARSMLEKLRNC